MFYSSEDTYPIFSESILIDFASFIGLDIHLLQIWSYSLRALNSRDSIPGELATFYN